MSDALVARVIQHYYPDWEPPEDTGKTWLKCLCPFHGESNPSAAISFELDGFNCFACNTKGDAISIIRKEEGVGFVEAKRIAESICGGVEANTRMGRSVRSLKQRTHKVSIQNRKRPWA